MQKSGVIKRFLHFFFVKIFGFVMLKECLTAFRGVRAALIIEYFQCLTIRKTFRVLSKTKRKRSGSYIVRTQLSRYERVRVTI